MEEAKQATAPIISRVRECEDEMTALREYCEAKFPVGPSSDRRTSVTGEPYIELAHPWFHAYPVAALKR